MKKIVVAIPFLLAFFSCKEQKFNQKTTEAGKMGPLNVEGLVIQPATVSDVVEVAGNILPFELTEIRPEISGRVTSIPFKEGSSVEAKTLLVKLFDGDLQAQLRKLEVQLQIAEKTEERERELLKINGISQQDYDLSLLQVNNIKADIELTKVAIYKTEIRAPYSGRIGLRNISLGAYVTPSNIITSISQVSMKKISFSIPEKYSSSIRPNMNVEFTIAGSNDTFTASVLASETTIESETRNLRVLATVRDGNNVLVPGSFAKVKLIMGTNNAAVSIPSMAIIPSARSKQVILYRDSLPVFVDVTTGIRNEDNVQITSGINVGDTLVTTGLLFIRKDSKLKLVKIQ